MPPPRGAAAPDDRRGLASEVGLTAAARRILGDGPRWRPAEVWEQAGVPEPLARRLWLAMGFPHLPDGEALLTAHDLQALRRAGELLAEGALDADHLVHQARLMAQAVSTVATAHVESLLAPGGGDALLSGLADDSADPVALVSELLEYLYRRHLYAALERAVLTNRGDEALAATAVGFADLSGFSARSAAATEDELTVMIDAFVATAADLVAASGGRVVKLLGDAVLFTVGDARAAAEVALDLAADHGAAGGPAPEAPAVHIGVAWGPVVAHHGDVFGSTVNVASRLGDAARPGTVLVDGRLADVLSRSAGLELRRSGVRSLKGLGPVRAYLLRRRPPGTDDRLEFW